MGDPIPFDETGRLAALRALDLLDTDPEAGFDDLVEVARTLAATPIALVSLIDAERQWFKARAGLDVAETPRSMAFCDHAIRGDGVLVTLDASRDPRFADNPLVTGDPFIRFYAGAPIRTPEGHAIGTVCVIGTQPRERFDAAPALAALARQAAALIELRRMARIEAAVRSDALRDLERLWTLTHDLMLVCDLDGVVMAANPAWQAVFGPLTAPGALEMRGFLVDPAARPRLREIANGGAVPFTTDYFGADRAIRTISWTLRREDALIYAIGRDDTALRIAEADLAQAQKMESLGQLTGGIAHDFNNLLTIIVGNLDIAGRRLRSGDLARVERALADAGEGAGRAATLTQRLLAFARRQRLAPRAVDPARLLVDVRPLVERAVSETVEIELVAERGVWPVEIDVNQLENAILNLAVNARDAMDGRDGAAMLISIGNHRIDAAEAGRHGARAGDYVRLTVADTGAGMSEEVRARAFEPFFTTKSIGRGTGLGLSQVHGFVRQSGGFVTIDTRPGEGTGVHLWLPRTATVPDDTTLLREPVIETSPRPAFVMVVEDNDAVRELVVETLRDAGYRVIEAHDGRSALALFARQSPMPDLVVSDVMMPRLDGFALADELLVRAPGTRILLMSGYAGADAATRPGREPLLVKPFTPDALLDRVRALLAV
ncbi:hybrid sensor histidine kinase/response regulator [Nostoc sp. 3335mG]|nr:hybrid sensor histidine kinase/response regulator [Nostoc sp. 3335mG]